MDRSIEFYLGISREMKELKCSEMYIGVDDMSELITRLRQAEKDAARYRWIKANSQLGVGRCGVDWELYFEGPAPDNSAMIELHIDEAMQCK